MSTAYKCDGCACYHDGPPAFSGHWCDGMFVVHHGDLCGACFRGPRTLLSTLPEPTVGDLLLGRAPHDRLSALEKRVLYLESMAVGREWQLVLENRVAALEVRDAR